MAGPGTFTAYQQLQPIRQDAADFVAQQEDLNYRARQEKRYEDQLAEQKKAREAAAREKLATKYASVKGAAPTGIKSLDTLALSWTNQVKDRLVDLYEKELRGEQLTPEEAATFARLEKTPETIALMYKSFQDEDARYFDMLAKGEIKRDLNYEQRRNSMIEGAVPFLDDDGNPTLGFDKDGDGKPDFVSYDASQGISLKPNYIKNIGYDTLLKEVSATLKPATNEDFSGYTTTTVKGLPVDVAQDRANRMVYTATGQPSDLAVSYFYDAGVEPENITPEMLQTFERRVAQDLLNSVERGVERDFDFSARNADRQEARQARKDAREEETYSLNDIYYTTNTIENTNGSRVKTGNNYQGNVDIKRKVGKSEESFKAFGIDRDGNITVTVDVATPDYTDSQIESMTANIEDEAERAAKIQELSTPKITTKTYSSKDQGDNVTFYAQRFIDPETGQYIKTAGELKRKLKSKGSSDLGEPQKQTIEGF